MAVVSSRIVRHVLSSRRKRTSKSRRPAVWVWSRGSAPSHASVMELPAASRLTVHAVGAVWSGDSVMTTEMYVVPSDASAAPMPT